MSSPAPNTTSILKETRLFPPPASFAAAALISAAERDRLAEWAANDPDAFWAEQAKSLDWYKPWDRVLTWEPPFAKWFEGGQINVSGGMVNISGGMVKIN